MSTSDQPRISIAWKDLSADTRNVLEWLENPNTGVLHTMTLELGQKPLFDGQVRTGPDVVVTEQMFKEASLYVRSRAAFGIFEAFHITDTTITAQLVNLSDKADVSRQPGL